MRRRAILTVAIGLIGAGFLAGCPDNSPPPPRVPVPAANNQDVVLSRDPVKPLPAQAPVPLAEPVHQEPPQ
jgi:hypothetical protein